MVPGSVEADGKVHLIEEPLNMEPRALPLRVRGSCWSKDFLDSVSSFFLVFYCSV